MEKILDTRCRIQEIGHCPASCILNPVSFFLSVTPCLCVFLILKFRIGEEDKNACQKVLKC